MSMKDLTDKEQHILNQIYWLVGFFMGSAFGFAIAYYGVRIMKWWWTV